MLPGGIRKNKSLFFRIPFSFFHVFLFPLFLCTGAFFSCAAGNPALLLEELKAGKYDFFLRADNAAYRSVKKMGRGSAYYVGLHLKRAGYEDAARFYFVLGEKLYAAPFPQLCREELYRTGSVAARLEAVEKRLGELAKAETAEQREEKQAVAALQASLLLSAGRQDAAAPLPEVFYRTAALTAELAAAFPQYGESMPLFDRTLTAARIRVFEKRYEEAWTAVQAAFQAEYSLAAIAYSPVLSDIGKAAVYGSRDPAEAAAFFEKLLEAVQNSDSKHTLNTLSDEQKQTLLFYASFYAARTNVRAGGAAFVEKAAVLFEKAAGFAVTAADFDSALWYYLDTLRQLSFSRYLTAVEQTAVHWKTPSWYADLVEELRMRLTAKKDWKGLKTLYTALSKTDMPEQRSAAAYVLARSGSLPQREAQRLFKEAAAAPDSLYYRMLAGYHGKHNVPLFLSSGTKRSGGGKAVRSASDLSPQEAEVYIDGLIHFGLYAIVYRHIAERYPSIPAEKAEQIAAVLESKGLYGDSMRLTALALRNQGTAPTDAQLRRLYPRYWGELVEKYADEYGLPPYLLYAVIRGESFFQPDAVSAAGAVGLTQLMPATAADIAKRLKVSDYRLSDPEINIRFGAYYLAEMIKRSDNRIMLACCAYNAGPTKVRNWRRKIGAIADDLFLEVIEYAETRGYGRKILTGAVVYGSLYYGIQPDLIIKSFFSDQ